MKNGQKEPTPSSESLCKTCIMYKNSDKKNRPFFSIFPDFRTKRTDPFFRFYHYFG